jgi:hypothetical protein
MVSKAQEFLKEFKEVDPWYEEAEANPEFVDVYSFEHINTSGDWERSDFNWTTKEEAEKEISKFPKTRRLVSSKYNIALLRKNPRLPYVSDYIRDLYGIPTKWKR